MVADVLIIPMGGFSSSSNISLYALYLWIQAIAKDLESNLSELIFFI